MLTGRCFCGACSYEIVGEPIVVAHCHCLDCQKLSGAGHTTGAMFSEEGVTIVGDPALYSLKGEGGNTVTRLFCATCGSPLFGMNTGMPGVMTVTLGTLDAPRRACTAGGDLCSLAPGLGLVRPERHGIRCPAELEADRSCLTRQGPKTTPWPFGRHPPA